MIAYEFLINNAGAVEKNVRADAFYESRHSEPYHILSTSTKYFLTIWNVLWFILLLLYTWKVIKSIPIKIIDFFSYRIEGFEWYFVVDLGIIWLSYVTLALWLSFTFRIFTKNEEISNYPFFKANSTIMLTFLIRLQVLKISWALKFYLS